MNTLKKFYCFRITDLIRQVIFAWIFAVTIEFLLLPGQLRDLGEMDGLAQMSLLRVIALTLAGALILHVVSIYFRTKRLERWCIVGVFSVLSLISLCFSFSWGFLLACIGIGVILVFYGRYGSDKSLDVLVTGEKASKSHVKIMAALCVVFFLFVSIWTVSRIYCFRVSTFDFGLFAQMFHSMKTTGLPMTTLERDGLLSHFHVHMSPIYYLMLPFYCLVPTPATLQVLQALVLTSAVIPLWKIGKLHGLSSKQRLLLCAALLAYPAYSCGAGFDLHENCFLTPLILWTFYGIDSKRITITAICALLTLTVKEDAAVYVAVIAIWLIIRTVRHYQKSSWKELLMGICMLVVSLAWFFVVTSFLANIGDGVMTNRYENFIYDGSGSLITVIKSVILSPMKALYESVEIEKLGFIALTMLPLSFLPFITRKYERYLLLIPYFLINLMSDYKYQHSIYFQYTFGPTAFLMYLTAVNLVDIRADKLRIRALGAAIVIGLGCVAVGVAPKVVTSQYKCIRDYERYEAVRDALDLIDPNASVTATARYTTHLSDREVVYDVLHCMEKHYGAHSQKHSPTCWLKHSPEYLQEHLLSTEYVALEITAYKEYKYYDSYEGAYDGFSNLVALLESNGYKVFYEIENEIVIYKKS